MRLFSSFNLLSTLHLTLTEKGLVEPTEIQQRAIPLLLQGSSVVGVAETGSGKTLAYVLPVLHSIKELENKGDAVSLECHPRVVVVVPTRELGEQVSRVFKPFTHQTRLRVRTVLGGSALEVSKKSIQGRFEVLVATPGRLVQFLNRSLLNLKDVRILVFDEVDQMMDPGFLPNARQIVEACSPHRQIALFSATVSSTVQELINKFFLNVKVIRSQGSHRLVPTLTTKNLKVLDGKRFPLLEKLLSQGAKGGTLIFANTRDQCDKLAFSLQRAGYTSAIYRGEMDKVLRRANLKKFREGKVELLISTDLASRGLDVDHIGRVINYHMPENMDNYIHRVGRTARAGRKGLVINLVTERDQGIVNQLDKIQARQATS